MMIGAAHVTIGADHTSGALPIAPLTNDFVHKIMIGRVRKSVEGAVKRLGHLGGIVCMMGGVQVHLQATGPGLLAGPGLLVDTALLAGPGPRFRSAWRRRQTG